MPHWITNASLYLGIAVACWLAIRASDRTRLWIGVAVFVASLAYGLWEFGLFS